MDIRFYKEYESCSVGENQQRIPTKKRMRHIIHSRQNVNNILAWKIILNRLLGCLRIKIRRRELVFTSKTLIIQNTNWLKDGHSNPQRENESYSTGDTNPKSAWDILFITGRPWIIHSKGKDTRDTGYWVYNRWLTKKRDNRYQASG